jgi:hypothetical protein
MAEPAVGDKQLLTALHRYGIRRRSESEEIWLGGRSRALWRTAGRKLRFLRQEQYRGRSKSDCLKDMNKFHSYLFSAAHRLP